MDETRSIAIFIEQKLLTVVLVYDESAADAYCRGFCRAAEHFFANASLYVLPGDLEEMRREQPEQEVRAALELT